MAADAVRMMELACSTALPIRWSILLVPENFHGRQKPPERAPDVTLSDRLAQEAESHLRPSVPGITMSFTGWILVFLSRESRLYTRST
jgi:hypothetical protein